MIPTFEYGVARFAVSVVVLSHDRVDELRHNLPELINSCGQLGYELIVVTPRLGLLTSPVLTVRC
jgi:hypothetical protein